MKALLVRMWKDTSGSGLLEQVLLVSGVSLMVIPATQKVGVKLTAVFSQILRAFP